MTRLADRQNRHLDGQCCQNVVIFSIKDPSASLHHDSQASIDWCCTGLNGTGPSLPRGRKGASDGSVSTINPTSLILHSAWFTTFLWRQVASLFRHSRAPSSVHSVSYSALGLVDDPSCLETFAGLVIITGPSPVR